MELLFFLKLFKIFLTLLTSLRLTLSSYKILPAWQNKLLTLKPLLAEVSINKSNLFLSFTSFPSS